jgi:hypothetical protein
MKTKLIAVAAVILSVAGPISAHRLDQYLQATLISVEKDHVQASMRLIPGVAVSSAVLASVDTNADGLLSNAEQQAYAQQVMRDVSISIDGKRLTQRVVSVEFPKNQEMRAGLGEIKIELSADLPTGAANRKLIFENHHQSRIAAYLVNCLIPRDKDIHVTAQNRNELQSFYQLEYVRADIPTDSFAANSSPTSSASQNTVLAPVLYWFHGFAGMYRLGIRHIADGTDHLLFLLALLLPAPLLAAGARWTQSAGVRQSLLRIVKVVTAFTLGHSLTLALAALGFVRLPSRPIEVLIAVSILVSALHALRPLFPGSEAAIAAFFGLIHGLAFATTLGELGLDRWQRVSSIFGFNLGIETMQVIVVAATMPSLILLSRTRAYSTVRIAGALFAVFASVGWIVERLLDVHTSVDAVVNSVAQHAVWIAVGLFLISLLSWSVSKAAVTQTMTTDPLAPTAFESS